MAVVVNLILMIGLANLVLGFAAAVMLQRFGVELPESEWTTECPTSSDSPSLPSEARVPASPEPPVVPGVDSSPEPDSEPDAATEDPSPREVPSPEAEAEAAVEVELTEDARPSETAKALETETPESREAEEPGRTDSDGAATEIELVEEPGSSGGDNDTLATEETEGGDHGQLSTEDPDATGAATELEYEDSEPLAGEEAGAAETDDTESDRGERLGFEEAATALADGVPVEWEEALKQDALEPSSSAEAGMWVMLRAVEPYREHLLFAEKRVRHGGLEKDVATVTALLDDLREENRGWIAQLMKASEVLESETGAGLEGSSRAMVDELLNQAARVESTQKSLDKTDLKSDLQAGGKRVLTHLAELLETADIFRDHVTKFLAATLRSAGRLQQIERRAQLDRSTEMYNRVGFESVFERWFAEEGSQLKELSVVLIDIDHFAKLNAGLGHQVGDAIIRGVAGLLQQLLRKNRGYDRIARTGGQAFALFLGETNAQGAVCAAERMRQVIEATSFEVQDLSVEITVSCAVFEVDPDESIDVAYQRLDKGIKEAKRAGRNRTHMDDLLTQEVVDPLPYQVKSRVISLDLGNGAKGSKRRGG